MILSHRWRFLFIKTRKTGSTSVEIALSTICGPEDVITPITEEDEALRAELGGRPPQNCLIPAAQRSPVRRLWKRLGGPGQHFYNHIPAALVRQVIEPGMWDGYTKFTIERNPYDRLLSAYYWNHPEEPRPTVLEFLGSARALHYHNAPLYQGDRGALLVDHVLRYEDLDRELARIGRRLELPDLPPLPRAKGGYRPDRRPPSEVLGPAERALVAQRFHDEIERFGYVCE